jgi:hypothetical protein
MSQSARGPTDWCAAITRSQSGNDTRMTPVAWTGGRIGCVPFGKVAFHADEAGDRRNAGASTMVKGRSDGCRDNNPTGLDGLGK